MSGHYDYPMTVPPLDQFETNYAIYDPQYGQYQRMSGHSTPHEGIGFWYRPEPQEAMYPQDPSMFGANMPAVQANALVMTDAQTQKHRRTRSGCFTCRSRRVKCDETRPVCDRCRKGNRECEFPQSSSSNKRSKTEPRSATSETASQKLDTIEDESDEGLDDDGEENENDNNSITRKPSHRPTETGQRSQWDEESAQRPIRQRQQSSGSITSKSQLASPRAEGRVIQSADSPRLSLQASKHHWRTLKPDLKPETEKYLRFQRDHMTAHHYLFKVDPEDFVHKELIDMALQFEPLLYAVVAFIAYHYNMQLPDSEADFNSFWKWYCKSIIKLRRYLESTEERDDFVLLTVLQLATFEEYMGDWTNLATHHRAAYGILISNYTPESIMANDRTRKIFDWYVRMDVIAGLMAIQDVRLDRSWMAYAVDWHKDQVARNKNERLDDKLIYFSKDMEVIAFDVAHTFAQANELLEKGISSIDNVFAQAKQLHARLDKIRRSIQELNDPAYSRIDAQATHDKDDVFDPKVPLFRDALWQLNFVWLDWYGILILLKKQTLLAMQKAQQLQSQLHFEGQIDQDLQQQASRIPDELTSYSKVQCQIFNAIISSPTAPAGATLVCYAGLGLSTVFLPRAPPAENSKYTIWARKQLANIERQGYVWPPHFRREMAQLWQDPSIEDWWLPNDDGKKRILTEIRAVVEDRLTATMTSGKNDGQNDLREIKGLFEKMDLGAGRREALNTLDPAYINSAAGMAHAASLVSTPEDASSTGSAAGLSPRSGILEIDRGKQRQRRKSSKTNSGESPLAQSMM